MIAPVTRTKFNRIVKRRRRESEVPRMSTAIRNFCLECMAYNSAEIERCTDRGCWLHPLRSGKYPPGYHQKQRTEVPESEPMRSTARTTRPDDESD